MAGTAIGILWLRNLIAVVMLSSIYSLLSAALFIAMNAPDVALTEAAVGAGASTVLLLAAVSLTRDRLPTEPERKRTPVRPAAIFIVFVTGAALIYGTLSLPPFGAPDTPAQLHVAPRYLEEAPAATASPNVVTAVLASYRGFDTLGEVTVVFTAGLGVLLLLGGRRKRGEDDEG